MRKNAKGNNIFQSLIHPIMLGLYRITVGPIIAKLMFNSKATGLKLSTLKGPYILIGNHVNNYDSLIHQFYSNRIISYVINERIFRMGPKGALGKIMHWVHFIPKKKFSNDIRAVRKLFKSKEQGRIIGIFPEGRRNWDGTTSNIISSIATLVKSLKIPVVAAITKGGFASQPRWGDEIRKGKVEVEFKMIIDSAQIKEKNADQILEAIQGALSYKEHEYLNKNKIFFKYKNPAEGLERMLFICPSCHAIGKLTSLGDKVECECGYSATYNNYAELTCEHFANLEEWNNWQKTELKRIKESDITDAIFYDNDIVLSCVASNSFDKLEEIDVGTAKLYKNTIVFEGKNSYEFPVNKLWGCNIQKNCGFEFNYENTMYLLNFPDKKNAYKWTTYIEL